MKMKVTLFPLLCVLTLLMSTTTAVYAADPPGIPDGWSSGYIYANGVRLHYYRAVPAPGKPVIVMIHGVTDNGLCWTTLTQELQPDYDIYMLDTRGHGLSDPFTAEDDGDTLIKDVVSVNKALKLKNPILMGHSMGAATVMRVGAEHPDLARSIIMLDPFLPRIRGEGRRGASGVSGEQRDEVSCGQGEQEETQESRKAEPVMNRLSVKMMADPATLVKQNNYRFRDLVATGRRQFPKWDDVDIQYWALSKKQYHGAYSNKAWQAMSGSMRTGDALSKITVPALILKADASPERRQSNQAVVKHMKNVKIVHISGGGHNLHHDERKQTVKILTEFLSTLK